MCRCTPARRSGRPAPGTAARRCGRPQSCARRSPNTRTGTRTFFSIRRTSVSLRLPRLVELERRDAQAFLVDLGRVRGVRARDAAADVGVVADRRGEGEPLAVDEDRLEDEDVGQVHAAFERVVHDEDVARPDVVPEAAQHRRQRGRDRAEVAGQGQALRDQPAVGVAERRRVVHVVLAARPNRPCARWSAPSRRRSTGSRS